MALRRPRLRRLSLFATGPDRSGPGLSPDRNWLPTGGLAVAVALLLLAVPIGASWPVAGVATATAGGSGSVDEAGLDQPAIEPDAPALVQVESLPRVSDAPIGPPVEDLVHRVDRPISRLTVDGWELPVSMILSGYTRQAADDPLDHDARRRVYEQVKATPGAHIAAIVDRTSIPRSTVRYHLRVLEEADRLASGMVRGRHRYAPTGVDLAVAAALHDEPTRAILSALARSEPVSVSGLAAEIGRAPSTVSHHLDHLTDARLIDRERVDGRVSLELGPAAADGDRSSSGTREVPDRAGPPTGWVAR